MIVTWRLVSILSLVRYTQSACSSTSYYRNCWIRRFPGLHVDPEEAVRRGARLLQLYRGDSAQNCSRACCLTSNFSCNVAVFHYNTTEDSVNCFHLHCPTLQSCILHQKANVILYNVTKGMDPDLLIFGKSFPSNFQLLPQLASLNTSDLSGTDKRQFNRPHLEPSSSAHPTILATSPKTSTTAPTSSFTISTPPPFSIYSTQDNQDTLPASAIQRSTTLKRSSQLISTRMITSPSTDPTIISTTKASPSPSSTMQHSFSFTNSQTSSMPQPSHTSSTTTTSSQLSSQLPSSSLSFSQAALLGTTTAHIISQTASTEFKALRYLAISTTLSNGHTTTATPVPSSCTVQSTDYNHGEAVQLQSDYNQGETTTISVPLATTPQISTGETTTMTVPQTTTPQSSTGETTTMSVPITTTPQSSTEETTTLPDLLSSILQSSTGKTTTIPVPTSSILQSTKGESTTKPVLLSSTLQSSTVEITPTSVPRSSTSHGSIQGTTPTSVPLSSTPQSIGEVTITSDSLSSTPQGSIQEYTTTPASLSSIPQSRTGETTTTPVLLSSILQSIKGEPTAQTTLATTPPTPVKTTTGYVTTTTGPHMMSNSFTTTSWSYNQIINTQSTASPLMEKRTTPSSSTDGLSQGSINLFKADVSVTTTRPTTLNRLNPSRAASETNSGLHTSPTPPIMIEDSQPYPNDTKGYVSRNLTTGNSPQPVSDGGLTQVWHLAANTVLVALATCAALACGCCCSVLMAASWRGRRRRKGRYQTTMRGNKGSMRLIKYVFVRESS